MVSILSGPERRRRWSTIEKLRIVEESHALSARVVDVARWHDVHSNLLTVWRRQARTGSLGAVKAPPQANEVRFAAVSMAPEPSVWAAACAGTAGTIEIAFAHGVQVRISPVTIPCLRAMPEMVTPDCSVSLTIASFCSSLKKRRAGIAGACGTSFAAPVKLLSGARSLSRAPVDRDLALSYSRSRHLRNA